MKIDIITIFPNLFDSVFSYGIIDRARKSKLIEINIHDLRDYTEDKHRLVDDRPFGGGAGMILKPEPLFKAIEALSKKGSYVVYLSPQGKTFNQEKAEELTKIDHIIMICGRYEGIDQRVIDTFVNEEISIGNYVLGGGEIPAMVVVDSITRLVPGVIGNEEFNQSESFSDPADREKLDFKQYTRPADFRGLKVPDVLLTGNHKEIEKWRNNNS